MYKRKAILLTALWLPALLCLGLSAAARADALTTTETQVADTTDFESEPVLGNDGATDLVVYTSFNVSTDVAKLYYQRLICQI